MDHYHFNENFLEFINLNKRTIICFGHPNTHKDDSPIYFLEMYTCGHVCMHKCMHLCVHACIQKSCMHTPMLPGVVCVYTCMLPEVVCVYMHASRSIYIHASRGCVCACMHPEIKPTKIYQEELC